MRKIVIKFYFLTDIENYRNIKFLKFIVKILEKMYILYDKDLNYFDFIDIKQIIPQSKKYSSIIDYINYGVYQFGDH